MRALSGWENFYVIVGSSAGALIGSQFVVLTLIANRPVLRGEAQAGTAFSTPSVVHFGVVLLLSAVISAPWDGIPPDDDRDDARAGRPCVLTVRAARNR